MFANASDTNAACLNTRSTTCLYAWTAFPVKQDFALLIHEFVELTHDSAGYMLSCIWYVVSTGEMLDHLIRSNLSQVLIFRCSDIPVMPSCISTWALECHKCCICWEHGKCGAHDTPVPRWKHPLSIEKFKTSPQSFFYVLVISNRSAVA